MSKNSIFDKWNKNIGEGFADEVADLDNGQGGDFPEIPYGDYEVKVNKMELKASKAGDPMLSVQFKILEGQYKNSLIFMNQVLTMPFQIHKANDFMRSLDTGMEIKFKDYTQYADLILDVSEEIDKQKLEYALGYGVNEKGYDTFEILEVFEQE